jgi:hypothetical protein
MLLQKLTVALRLASLFFFLVENSIDIPPPPPLVISYRSWDLRLLGTLCNVECISPCLDVIKISIHTFCSTCPYSWEMLLKVFVHRENQIFFCSVL